MQRFTMQCAIVLVCGAMALGWGSDKNKPKGDSEQNQTVVREVFDDVFNRGNFELIGQIYEPNCIVHHRNKTMTLGEAIKDAQEWRSAAPDMKMTIEKVRGEGNLISVHWIARGTNTGVGHGLTASGKPIVVKGHTEFRVTNGKIAEEWNDFNEEEIFKQVGQTPGKH